MKKICEYCTQTFEDRKHPKKKFCSIACRDAARTHRVQMPCSCCGTTVERHLYRARKFERTFCSEACEAKWSRMHCEIAHLLSQEYIDTGMMPCDNCGVLFYRSPSQIYAYNFCCKKCQGEWRSRMGIVQGSNSPTWKGGHTDYRGPNWETQRRAALKRDNHTCQQCGSQEKLQVHHKMPYQLFASYIEANNLDNLVALCMICHTSADWEYRRTHPGLERLLPDTRRIHTCLECGKPFEAKGPNARRCEECWQRTCERCGKTFRPHLWHEKNKFCSRECAGTSKRVLSE